MTNPSGSMPCPKCGTVMAEGWATSKMQLSWSARPPGPNVPEEHLEPWPLWNRKPWKHSFLCRACKIVIIEYAKELEENRTVP